MSVRQLQANDGLTSASTECSSWQAMFLHDQQTFGLTIECILRSIPTGFFQSVVNRHISQACAVCSPKSGSVSEMGMLRQSSRSLGEEPSQPEDCARCDRNSEESEYHLQTEKTSCRIASDLDEVQEGASVFDAF